MIRIIRTEVKLRFCFSVRDQQGIIL